MQIRPATASDLDAVQALLQDCHLPSDDLTPAHLEHFLVGVVQERVVGVVGLEPKGEAALLRSLAVSPRHRGEKAGRCLLEAIEKQAPRKGIAVLYLLTTTAAEYFDRLGYERMERAALPPAIRATEEVTRLCPGRATCMQKRLAVPHDAPG